VYLPKHFQVDDLQILARLIAEYPLATLVGNLDEHLEVNHLPLILSADGKKLHGHIARTNPLVKVAEQNKRDVTAVFHGPNAYITPAWYPSKQETGKVVPTWNYAVVHVQGQLSLMSDPSWIRDHVSQMTNIHEPIYQSNWKLDDAPEEYIQMMLKAIIGIEIEVASLVGKFKLSQNRSPSEYAGVVENLQKSPEENLQALLHLMKKP
jgi:transcriptional regulator